MILKGLRSRYMKTKDLRSLEFSIYIDFSKLEGANPTEAGSLYFVLIEQVRRNLTAGWG